MPYQKIQKTIFAGFILLFSGLVFCAAVYAESEIEFIPGEDSGFFYIIKKGDTLWDLSEKFYNSEWDWPGLWQMNDEIKNPHLIYPGRKVRIFFQEKGLRPKIVTVTKIKKVPPPPVKPSFSFAEMDQVSFVRKTQEPSLGSIIKQQDGQVTMATDDIIYIRPSGNGSMTPGKVYQIFSATELEEKIAGEKFQGIKHLIKAEVKILDNTGKYAKGIIQKTFRAVYEEDLIMEYFEREKVLTVEENPPNINARLIGSEDRTILVNDYQIGFIDAGKDTVKPGQIYTVFRKNDKKDYTFWQPKKHEDIELEDLKSGKLIVLHTEDISSTVMIMSSTYAIYTDDIVK